jgi:hypothetical protein
LHKPRYFPLLNGQLVESGKYSYMVFSSSPRLLLPVFWVKASASEHEKRAKIDFTILGHRALPMRMGDQMVNTFAIEVYVINTGDAPALIKAFYVQKENGTNRQDTLYVTPQHGVSISNFASKPVPPKTSHLATLHLFDEDHATVGKYQLTAAWIDEKGSSLEITKVRPQQNH